MKIILVIILFFSVLIFAHSEEIDVDYYNIELKEMSTQAKSWDFNQKNDEKKYSYLVFFKENFKEYYNYYIYYLSMSKDMGRMKDEFIKTTNIPDGLSVNLSFSKGFKMDYTIGYKFIIYFDSEKIAKGEVEW